VLKKAWGFWVLEGINACGFWKYPFVFVQGESEGFWILERNGLFLCEFI